MRLVRNQEYQWFPPNEDDFMTNRLITCRPAIAFAASAWLFAIPNATAQQYDQTGFIDTLFKLAQYAERPEHRQDESLNCPAAGAPVVTVPDLTAVPFPPTSTQQVDHELLVREVPHNPFSQLSSNNDRLYVVCRKHLGIDSLSVPLDIAVEMMVLRPASGPDTVHFEVVARRPDGTVNDWTPITEPNGLVTFPGTDPEDWRQMLANFVGQMCLFPAAHIALHALCTVAEPRDARLDRESSEETVTAWLRIDADHGAPTVVGHSLGGAVTQYIAVTSPPSALSTDAGLPPRCPGVNAYAFGSTGLRPNIAGHTPSIHGQLTSYASDCDELVQELFRGRVQPGRLFTLPSYSHWIDDIQSDLCRCRRFASTQWLHDHGPPTTPPANLGV